MDKDLYLSHLFNQLDESKLKSSPSSTEKTRVLLKLINSSKINHELLESSCFQGIPVDCNGLRPLCWKILLGYLPDWPAKWESTLETKRKTYINYLRDLILPRQAGASPTKKVFSDDPLGLGLGDEEETKGEGNSKTTKKGGKKAVVKVSNDFHPLGDRSVFSKGTPASDNQLWDDIVKDTRRTRSDVNFFQNPTEFPLKVLLAKENINTSDQETHTQALTRMLYIYGKLHPELNYIQGMNELLAPLYYFFYNDQNPAFFGHAEADCFHCFSILIDRIKDSFAKSFNIAGEGIQARITALNDLLKTIDREIWDHLDNNKVEPQFYTLRWLMLLLAQEFEMSEVGRLWDTLYSHRKKLDYLNFICVAMILQVKKKLLATNEFSTLMEILQRDTTENLDQLLIEAYKLYIKYTKPEEIVSHLAFAV